MSNLARLVMAPVAVVALLLAGPIAAADDVAPGDPTEAALASSPLAGTTRLAALSRTTPTRVELRFRQVIQIAGGIPLPATSPAAMGAVSTSISVGGPRGFDVIPALDNPPY